MIKPLARLLGVVSVAIAVVLGVSGSSVRAQTIIDVDPTDLAITLAPEERTSVRIPYTLADGVAAGELEFTVVSVTRAGTPVAVDAAAVTIEADEQLSTLTVTIQGDEFARTGAYAVTLRMTTDADPDAAQLLGLAITRPAAELVLPSTDPIEIERTVWFPELDASDSDDNIDVTDPPVVLEVGVDSRLIELTARPLGTDEVFVTLSRPGAAANTSASVSAELITAALGPGELIELDESINGEPPLGEIERTVRLSSQQLAQPIDIRYEITTRRSRLLIPILIVIGLAFGALVRKLPAWYERQSIARSRRRSLQQALRALAEHPDDRVSAAAEHHLAIIEKTALRDKTLNDRIDAAITALNAALAAVDHDVAEQRTKLDEFALVVGRTWKVPVHTTSHLATVKSVLEAAYRLADAGAVINLKASVADLTSMLGPRLDDAIASDADAIKRALDPIAASLATAADPALMAVGILASDLATQATALPANDKQAADRLEWLHNLASKVEQFSARLRAEVLAVARRTNDESVRAAADRVSRSLRSGSVVASLAAARSDVESFVAATNNVPRPRDMAPGGSAQVMRFAEPSPALLAAAARFPQSQQLVAGVVDRAWQSFGLFVEAVRYAVLATLLLITSYQWFANDWFGTLPDVSTILLWAFGLDLTAEFVLQTAVKSPIAAGAAAVTVTTTTATTPATTPAATPATTPAAQPGVDAVADPDAVEAHGAADDLDVVVDPDNPAVPDSQDPA